MALHHRRCNHRCHCRYGLLYPTQFPSHHGLVDRPGTRIGCLAFGRGCRHGRLGGQPSANFQARLETRIYRYQNLHSGDHPVWYCFRCIRYQFLPVSFPTFHITRENQKSNTPQNRRRNLKVQPDPISPAHRSPLRPRPLHLHVQRVARRQNRRALPARGHPALFRLRRIHPRRRNHQYCAPLPRHDADGSRLLHRFRRRPRVDLKHAAASPG